MKYDFIVVGSWVNHPNVQAAVEALRGAGKTVYSFIDNEYDSDGIKQSKAPDSADLAQSNIEGIKDWQTNPTLRKMFNNDMNALKDSGALVIVFPAGLSSHMELGIGYGMGKKCYGIGNPAKVESLYLMLDKIFSSPEELVRQFA